MVASGMKEAGNRHHAEADLQLPIGGQAMTFSSVWSAAARAQDLSPFGGITKYSVAPRVLRVQGGWSKESAIKALLLGRRLGTEEVRLVRSVLDQLPSAGVRAPAADD